MKKHSCWLLVLLALLLLAPGCSKKKEADSSQSSSKPKQKSSLPEKKTKEEKPVFSTHNSMHEVTQLSDAKQPDQETKAGAPPAVDVASKPQEKPVDQADVGMNPLDLYDFEVVVERIEPYSKAIQDKKIAYWRVINSQIKSKADNLKQAKVVLSQMKRKHPDAYMYDMDINERSYSVPSKIGKVIPHNDQLEGSDNY